MGAKLRFLLLVAGLACLGATSLRALGDADHVFPGWSALIAAGVITAAGLALATAAWVTLADGAVPGRPLGAGFLGAQLGKYIPGGVWAGVGQIGFGVGAGLTPGVATGILAAYGVSVVVAAGVVAGLAAPWSVAVPTGWIVIGALTLPLLLVRGWLERLARGVGSILPSRLPVPVIPAQRPILTSFVLLVPCIACLAAGFAIVVRATGVDLPLPTIIAGFCVAWMAGFVAVGLPSGLGAREAVLVLMLDSGIGVVVAASVTHRLLQGAVEVILLIAVRRHVPDSRPTVSAPAHLSTRRSS